MIKDIKCFENFEMDNSSVSILYVEDEESIRNSIFKLLNRRFTKVYVAENGKEGLELYNQHHPDIIITDINMPMMSGLEMTKEIRKNDLQTPILVTSAYNSSDFLLEAIQIKVDAFILKPINKDDLLEKINRCSKKVQFNSFMQMFHLVAEQISKGLMLINIAGKIQYVNNSFLDSSGFEATELLLSSFISDEETLSPFQINKDIWRRLQNKEEIRDTVLRKRKSGKSYYQEYTINSIKNSNNKITHFVFMSEDVTEKQLEVNALKDEAKHDSLTGLFRRSVLENNIEKIIIKNGLFSFAMIDIDFFKSVNDDFGHDTGDKVLKQFSNIISSHLRNDDMLFRWGGEEFLLLLKNPNIDKVFTIIERIRKYIELEDFGIERQLTASIGLAIYEPQEDWTETLKRADKALYTAKNSGRNQTKKASNE